MKFSWNCVGILLTFLLISSVDSLQISKDVKELLRGEPCTTNEFEGEMCSPHRELNCEETTKTCACLNVKGVKPVWDPQSDTSVVIKFFKDSKIYAPDWSGNPLGGCTSDVGGHCENDLHCLTGHKCQGNVYFTSLVTSFTIK